MTIVGDSELYEVMQGLNPWWQNPAYASHPVRRTAFHETCAWFFKPDFKRALVLSGPRRVGKTVILHQLAQELITRGWNPKDILYLTLDHTIVKLYSLDRILKAYRENVRPGNGSAVLLLDEIQFAKDWTTWIKLTVDFKPEFRIVATGSAAVEIVSSSQESAVGRWIMVKVPTLSFYEYLALAGFETPVQPDDIQLSSLASMTRAERNGLAAETLPARDRFHEYLLKGGFPELVKERDLSEAQAQIREDVVNRVLKYDMTSLFGVRRIPEMERLFAYFCVNSGGLMDQKSLAKELGINVRTLSDYIDYLLSAGLIYLLPSIEMGGKSTLKARHKVYIADASIRNAVLMKGEGVLADDREMGLLVETAVYQHVHAWGYRSFPRFGYWRDRAGREVDLVRISPDGTILPIEVKYKSETRGADEKNLREFLKASGAKLGIMAVKRSEEFDVLPAGEARLLKIPAYLFMLLLGHAHDRRSRRLPWDSGE